MLKIKRRLNPNVPADRELIETICTDNDLELIEYLYGNSVIDIFADTKPYILEVSIDQALIDRFLN